MVENLQGLYVVNRQCLLKYHKNFKLIFGQPMQRYMHPIFGFDVVKFDEVLIKSPDGESCAEATRRLFGDAGAQLIEDILKSDLISS